MVIEHYYVMKNAIQLKQCGEIFNHIDINKISQQQSKNKNFI